MIVQIKIPGKAISTNSRLKPIRNKYTGKMRLARNTDNDSRKREIHYLMIKHNKELWALGMGFDRKIHYFKTSYRFIYAMNEFWTFKGEMSQKLLDAENGIKTVKDAIFDIIGVNDRASRVESSEVSPGHETFFEITIERRSFDDLPEEFQFKKPVSSSISRKNRAASAEV